MATEGPEERASWGKHIEFIITCVGFAVGLGNVWRFPHLAYENGGGAFLIPYVICLIFLGIPLFCLEIMFGQFASKGPITIWEINPLFKGLGYTMIMLVALVSIFYNIVVSYVIYFLFASMQSELPWMSCGNEWNTCFCRTLRMSVDLDDPLKWFNSSGLNCSGITFTNQTVKGSSEEYFFNRVLEVTDSIDDPGSLKWDITLCNLLAWTIICVALIKGVKSMGKAVYVSAIFPYILLTILVVRGVTLEGAKKGIDYYLTPDPSMLSKASVWKAAASQIFFSLSCCTGSLTAMSSYSKFKNNCFRDSIIIPIINCCTSFYAGFAIFSILGFMSENYGKDVANVITSGPGLVFVAYPVALGEMPLPQLWSILFFLMMLLLGMGSQFPGVETVMTAFQDEFPVLRTKRNNIIFRLSVCVAGFLLGLPQTTQGGYHLFNLCESFIGFPLMLVGFLEIVAIVWVYGPKRFTEDVLLIVGDYPKSKLLYLYYFRWNLIFVTPCLILVIIILDCLEYVPITGGPYPEWAESLGWMIVAFIMMWVPLWYLIGFCYRGGARLLFSLSQPSIRWGPAEAEYRTLPRYQRLLQQTNNTQSQGTVQSQNGDKSSSNGGGQEVEMEQRSNGQKVTFDNPSFVTDIDNSRLPAYVQPDNQNQVDMTAL